MHSAVPRTHNVFDPEAVEPYRLSRSKLEDFMRCPRCFYLDRRLGIDTPRSPPFSLNLAVDELLKREFDRYRETRRTHPLMRRLGLSRPPFDHPELSEWRTNNIGVQHFHAATGFLVYGAIDDVWIDDHDALRVIEYKATSTTKTVTLNDDWKISYKRQVELYQWLLRRRGFKVSRTSHFIYVNALKTPPVFAGRLEFETYTLSHTGDDSWIENSLRRARACLAQPESPPPTAGCDWCRYRVEARALEAAPR